MLRTIAAAAFALTSLTAVAQAALTNDELVVGFNIGVVSAMECQWRDMIDADKFAAFSEPLLERTDYYVEYRRGQIAAYGENANAVCAKATPFAVQFFK